MTSRAVRADTLAIGACLLLVTVFGLIRGASAQQGSETPPQGRTVSIDIGQWTYELDEDEPLTACVQETTTDFERTTARVIVFARLQDGAFAPLGTYTTEATAALAGIAVGDCRVLGEGS